MLPMPAWPRPATRVSGTAWAISVPTRRRVTRNGYSRNSATVPSAPAPMEVRVTMTPSTTPVSTVNVVRLRSLRW
ncbi:hypothetical protein D3C79_965480 [compost metagenome]